MTTHFTIELWTKDTHTAHATEQGEHFGANGVAAFTLLDVAFDRGVNAFELSLDDGEDWELVEVTKREPGKWFSWSDVAVPATAKKPRTFLVNFELPRG